jgi:hypothetical protein
LLQAKVEAAIGAVGRSNDLSRRLGSLGAMLRIYAKPFVEASGLIGQLEHVVLDPNVNAFAEQTKIFITAKIDSLIEQLEATGLGLTKQSALRLRGHVNTTVSRQGSAKTIWFRRETDWPTKLISSTFCG